MPLFPFSRHSYAVPATTIDTITATITATIMARIMVTTMEATTTDKAPSTVPQKRRADSEAFF